MVQWSTQAARKNRWQRGGKCILSGEDTRPLTVARRGKTAEVVLAVEDYRRL